MVDVCVSQEFNGDFPKACGQTGTFPHTRDVGQMQLGSWGTSLPHPALGAPQKPFRASLKTLTLRVTDSDKNYPFGFFFIMFPF